jgi:hypothetical protein
MEEEPLAPIGQQVVECQQAPANRGLRSPPSVSARRASDQSVEGPGGQMKELEIARSAIPAGMALRGEFVREFRFGTRLCRAPETSVVSPEEVASGISGQAE